MKETIRGIQGVARSARDTSGATGRNGSLASSAALLARLRDCTQMVLLACENADLPALEDALARRTRSLEPLTQALAQMAIPEMTQGAALSSREMALPGDTQERAAFHDAVMHDGELALQGIRAMIAGMRAESSRLTRLRENFLKPAQDFSNGLNFTA